MVEGLGASRLAIECLTQRRCVLLCNLIICYSAESAWFQHLKLPRGKLLLIFTFKFNLRRYRQAVEVKRLTAALAAAEAAAADAVRRRRLNR